MRERAANEAVAPQPAAPREPLANTPELISSAQNELRRLGCFTGRDDGNLSSATREAIGRYLSQKGRPSRDVKVTDEMVEENLEALRERAAKYSTRADRKAETGDVVVGTLSGRFLEGKGKDFSGEAITMRVGSEDNHPEFNASLTGLVAGDTRTFQIRYPEDYPSGVLAGR